MNIERELELRKTQLALQNKTREELIQIVMNMQMIQLDTAEKCNRSIKYLQHQNLGLSMQIYSLKHPIKAMWSKFRKKWIDRKSTTKNS